MAGRLQYWTHVFPLYCPSLVVRVLFLVVPPDSPDNMEPFFPPTGRNRKEAPVDAQGLAVWSLTVVGIPPGTSDPTLRAGVTVRLCAQITTIRPQGPPNVTLSVPFPYD